MKITKEQLKAIINEELNNAKLDEGAKSPEDEIRDLASELERGLEGDMKKKATAIIDLINVHFSKGTKTPDGSGLPSQADTWRQETQRPWDNPNDRFYK